MAIIRDRVTTKRRSWGWRLFLVLLYVVPLLAVAGFGAYYFTQFQKLDHMTADEFTQRENKRLIQDVSKVYSLPKDEEPSTVASVKDKEALKKQYAFFSQAENGDVVLIYQKAQLALIYRPSTKQIVKVGPLNVQSDPKISVIGPAEARKAIIKTLTDNKVAATEGGDARANYGETTVVDLSGKNSEQAKQLAQIINAKVATLPEGETKPDGVDLLVITAQ